jgi:hypothetical protein
MEANRSQQKPGNRTSRIVKIVKIIKIILLVIVFFMIFYHHGIAKLEKTWHYNSGFYITLADGRVFEVSACERGVDLSLGKHIKYTAIGFNLSPPGGRMIFKPVIIRCETW